MSRGRPPKPTALKKLAGNPGKRKPNGAEPKPKTERPPCPPHLEGEARQEWNRMSRELLRLGLLTRIDRAALAGYCQAWADWVEANRRVQEKGMVEYTENGYPILSAYWTAANQAAKLMRGFLAEFGMTPAARSRLRVETGEKKKTLREVLDEAAE